MGRLSVGRGRGNVVLQGGTVPQSQQLMDMVALQTAQLTQTKQQLTTTTNTLTAQQTALSEQQAMLAQQEADLAAAAAKMGKMPVAKKIGTALVNFNATVAIVAGINMREATFTPIAGETLTEGEPVMCFPQNLPSNAYALYGGPLAKANNKVEVRVQTPAIAIGQNISITLDVWAFRKPT